LRNLHIPILVVDTGERTPEIICPGHGLNLNNGGIVLDARGVLTHVFGVGFEREADVLVGSNRRVPQREQILDIHRRGSELSDGDVVRAGGVEGCAEVDGRDAVGGDGDGLGLGRGPVGVEGERFLGGGVLGILDGGGHGRRLVDADGGLADLVAVDRHEARRNVAGVVAHYVRIAIGITADAGVGLNEAQLCRRCVVGDDIERDRCEVRLVDAA